MVLGVGLCLVGARLIELDLLQLVQTNRRGCGVSLEENGKTEVGGALALCRPGKGRSGGEGEARVHT